MFIHTPGIAALLLFLFSSIDDAFLQPLNWRCIGPARGGRVTAVAGVRGQPLLFYMGPTGGGVWKTEDGGQSWRAVGDGFLHTGSVGAIAVSEWDPNVVYVGMGESCPRGNFSHGDGVYRSLDGGKTWSHVGLSDSRQIGRIVIHPKNPDLVYVAALGHIFGPNEERGVFRSRDGGKSWQKVLYVNELTGAVDLAMDPSNARVLYAALWQVARNPWSLTSGGEGSGLYRSSDGGDTWVPLKNGLPGGVKGKIGVTVSPARPDRVWAIVEADDGGVFRSDNGGTSWSKMNDNRALRQRAWYYSHIRADPNSEDTVYLLNVSVHKSTDGGRSFETLGAPHGDNHDLWIDPEDHHRMVLGNDGGACVTFNGGRRWTRQDNQPTAQFYHVITDNQFPYRVYGAQQDNSTLSISSESSAFFPGNDAYDVGGGESGFIAPSPADPNIVYAGSYGGYLTRYDHRARNQRNIMVWPENPMGWGADQLKFRFQWTFPIIVSPHDANTLYVGGNVVFRSTNEGQSWDVISPDLTTNDKSKQGPSGGPITKDNTSVEYYCTIFSLAESPLQKGVLWSGSDDGLVHLSQDGGGSWTNVTPLDSPKWALVNAIEPSPHDAASCYLAITCYKLDDFQPYVFKTSDAGRTWERRVTGVDKGAFVRVVREDPQRKGMLYAGTETGVYFSLDDGAHWQSLQRNLPVVPVTDLVVKDDDLVIATQGRSFWILSDLTTLRQLTPEAMSAPVHLFKPRATVRRDDVAIRYWLKDAPEQNLEVAFLDAAGNVVQSFQSKPDPKQEPQPPRAPAQTGMNTLAWHLRYPDAVNLEGAVMWGGGTQGPLAPPGQYQVRLTLGDKVLTQPFAVLKDPRVATTQAEFQAQLELLIKVRDQLSQVHRAVKQIREVRQQIDATVARAKGLPAEQELKDAAKQLTDKLTAIEDELVQTKSKSSQDPLNYPIKLNDKLAALMATASGDYGPTKQSYDVFDYLGSQAQQHLATLRDLMSKDVLQFNQLAKEQEVPAVRLEAPNG
ncbi:MAG: glycosyl hydrolase [Planctomycetota bacterium]